MRTLFFTFLFALISTVVTSQDIYHKNGIALEGYDVVSYFEGAAVKGKKTFATAYEEALFYFISEAHQKLFEANPQKYLPQYNGYCAYAIAKKGEKVSINPKSFLITDNKLYLFYNSWGVNTLKKWEKEGPAELQKLADKHWEQLSKQ